MPNLLLQKLYGDRENTIALNIYLKEMHLLLLFAEYILYIDRKIPSCKVFVVDFELGQGYDVLDFSGCP